MTMQSRILIALAIVAVLLGAIVLVFTVMGWPRIAAIDMEFLMTRYDPNGGPDYQAWRVSADLYHLTKQIGEQRNYHAMQFLCTLGLSFLAVGAILFAWLIDRERLSRRVRDLGR